MYSLSHRTIFQVLRSHTWLPHWTTQLDPPSTQTVLCSIAAEGSERLSPQKRVWTWVWQPSSPWPVGSGVGRRTGWQRKALAEGSNWTKLELLCSQNAIVLFLADRFRSGIRYWCSQCYFNRVKPSLLILLWKNSGPFEQQWIWIQNSWKAFLNHYSVCVFS